MTGAGYAEIWSHIRPYVFLLITKDSLGTSINFRDIPNEIYSEEPTELYKKGFLEEPLTKGLLRW